MLSSRVRSSSSLDVTLTTYELEKRLAIAKQILPGRYWQPSEYHNPFTNIMQGCAVKVKHSECIELQMMRTASLSRVGTCKHLQQTVSYLPYLSSQPVYGSCS